MLLDSLKNIGLAPETPNAINGLSPPDLHMEQLRRTVYHLSQRVEAVDMEGNVNFFWIFHVYYFIVLYSFQFIRKVPTSVGHLVNLTLSQ